MKYQGELYFEDDDVIDVISFIVRDDRSSVAFEVIASWGGQGKWRRSGVAQLRSDFFESDMVNSRQEETGQQGVPCRLRFRLLEDADKYLSISGCWIEEGSEYAFEGDLELKF
ncbi:hypothetical protein [Stutzerimonas kunmingensis]|uniref:hypothetical protein n=1 Tax=Stutzerimonas kunmingensis TaxID=1211807 RepID=UPI0028A9CA21|nr:hypothetical protein [Stutzerimonas kunmingensis]